MMDGAQINGASSWCVIMPISVSHPEKPGNAQDFCLMHFGMYLIE
jgi:hypothetical protein